MQETQATEPRNPLTLLWQRFGRWRRQQIADVPDEMAACEYECRKTDCGADQYDECERRQEHARRLAEQRGDGS